MTRTLPHSLVSGFLQAALWLARVRRVTMAAAWLGLGFGLGLGSGLGVIPRALLHERGVPRLVLLCALQPELLVQLQP